MAKALKWSTYTRYADLVKNRFKNINETVDEIVVKGEPVTMAQLRNLSAFSKELTQKQADYESNMQRVLDNDETDMSILTQDQDTINNLYAAITGKIEALTSAAEPTSPTSIGPHSSESNASHSLSSVRLPKLELKHFSGDPLSWISFINLFDSTIHSNDSLNNVAKFQYLLSTLSGEPLNLIKSLTLSAANYMVAYDLLKERYHSPRRLITLHLNQVIDLPNISASSPKNMRAFVNLYHEHTQALKALNCEITENNPLLSALILRKMDNALRQRLEAYRSSRAEQLHTPHTLPEIIEIIKFLSEECNHIEDANLHNLSVSSNKPISNSTSAQKTNKRVQFTSPSVSLVTTSTSPSLHSTVPHSCFVCKQSTHKVYVCPNFTALNPNQRYKLVKEAKRCTSCLGNHTLTNCKSKATCQTCQKRHHTLLHFEKESTLPKDTSHNVQNHTDSQENQIVSASAQQLTSHDPKSVTTVLLGTALVQMKAPNGNTHVFRALLDSGSMCDFISERAAQLLNAPRKKVTHSISGVSQTSSQTRGLATLDLSSLSGRSIATQHPFHILGKISVDLPRTCVSAEVLERVKPYVLADPTFHLPGPIDLLIGGSLLPLVLTNQTHSLGHNMPYVLGTHFGFIVMGSAPSADYSQPVTNLSVSLLTTTDDLHTSLQRFWQLEEPPMAHKKSIEEQQCEMHFETTHFRHEDGRYVVQLPFKEDPPDLGDSYFTAEQRFKSLEMKFARNPELKSMYMKSMKEHINEGHMVEVPIIDNTSSHYFLPHHGVIKESSTSTKLRIVYDASCKTSSGKSLNDTLMTGRKLQTDICDLLMHFRSYNIVFTCDIRQMYLQIYVEPSHRNYQLVLWRDEPSQPISTYKLTRVTFGMNSSPFLAIRTLHKLADDEGSEYPEAAKVLRTQTYVDDIITGADTLEEALKLQNQLTSLLGKGGFELRKWISNSPSLLKTLPQDHLESPEFLQTDQTPQFAVLGLHWSPEDDFFSYCINAPQNAPTKRNVLSAIAKIYDPCGFIAPFIMATKCFMQLLWTTGLSWDDPLPPLLASQWKTFTSNMIHISKIKIPRSFMLNSTQNVEIHGFSDASESGYAAVIYIRHQLLNGDVIVRQVVAKTRVAPLKKVTLPRLELCGAHLLAQLTVHCQEVLKDRICFSATYLWCDSSIVLTWLKTPPYRLKTFVANRVAQSQELVPLDSWRHIASADNPADCASRGILASHLVDHPLWWTGPAWLRLPHHDWPTPNFTPIDLADSEEIKSTPLTVLTTVQEEWNLLQAYSSWNKLQRIVALLLRFIFNCRSSISDRKSGILNLSEIDVARLRIFKLVQRSSFATDISSLQNQKDCSSRLQRLRPFLDSDGVLRVGGRLKHAPLPDEVRHPVLLPKSHHVVNLLIDHCHVSHLHAGPQLTQALLAQFVWIISARTVIRSRIFKCITCFKNKPRQKTPLMGDLPQCRVTPARPFLSTGTDYCGPFTAKVINLRSVKHFKVYLCIFVCMVTKAVHLEVVTDLTTEGFIAALTRFVSRRGLCADIYSDCGTNYVGADAALRRTLASILDNSNGQAKIQHFAVQRGIKFHFNPPAAPHQGGLWESAVKSVKYHLKRVMGDNVLTLSEFTTLSVRIEAMLNSRPLTPLSNDPSDVSALTPGHFLIGAPLAAVPEISVCDIPANRLKHWQIVQSLHQDIWKRWSLEYLNLLQQRSKWTHKQENLKVGDLVLVHSTSPPLQWPLARVIKLHPGADGIVRVVDLRTASGIVTRPVVKVFPLPMY